MAVFYSALGLTVLCIAARCVLGRNRAHYKALAWIMYCMAVLKMGLGLTIVATNPKCPDSCSGCYVTSYSDCPSECSLPPTPTLSP